MSTQPTNSNPAPVLYTLYFREGRNPHPQFSFFNLPTRDMKMVTERAKKHCEIMNYRFVYVRPAIIDLDKEENIFFQKD